MTARDLIKQLLECDNLDVEVKVSVSGDNIPVEFVSEEDEEIVLSSEPTEDPVETA